MKPLRHTLEASTRTVLGKEVEKLRRLGQTPGIVYGPVVATPAPVSVETKTLEKMYVDFGSNLLITLEVERKSYTVYMRNVDIDRLKRRPRHVEFYAPNLTIVMTADVPLVFTGEPGEERSVVTHGRERISIQGLPEAIPAVIEVDLSTLQEIGDAIHVSDLSFPDDVTVLTDTAEMVARLDAPQISAAAEEEEEAAAAEGEEAEETDGAEATEEPAEE